MEFSNRSDIKLYFTKNQSHALYTIPCNFRFVKLETATDSSAVVIPGRGKAAEGEFHDSFTSGTC